MKYGLSDAQFRQIIDFIAGYAEVEEAVLFGSRAIDTFKEASDVDIAIKGEKVTLSLAQRIQFDIEEETYLPFFFDIIAYSSIANESLVKHIDNKGVVIYRRGLSEWRECKLGDIATLHYGKGLKAENRIEGHIPVFSSAGLTGYHNQALADSKGLIIGRKGTIGKVYYSKHPFWCIDTAYYILPDDERYNFDYLYYLIQTLGLEELNEDSAVPGLNRETTYAQDISIPDLREQKAIAGVLSSLDDKIDLLHRQNKTLEQMAEALFRQWFIEEASEDWKEKQLKDVVDIGIGRTPPRQQHQWFSTNPDDIEWLSIKDLGNDEAYIFKTSEYLTQSAVEQFNIPIIPENTVVLSFKMTVGRVAITTSEMLSNEAIAHFKFNQQTPFTQEYLYFFLKLFKYDVLGTTSSIVTSINSTMIKNLLITLPDEDIMKRFSDITKPQFSKIKENQKQIQTLEKLRDNLLPKLMSGEIRVKPAHSS